MNPPTPEPSLPLVALVGRPNVGKSSLFNRLAKTRVAIVDPTPGVTRDRHYAKVFLRDNAFMLVDTGGIENEGDDPLSALITGQAWQAVGDAGIILFMLDGREGPVAEDYRIAALLRKSNKPIFCLVNKIDLPIDEERLLPPFFELGFDTLWPISSAHGYGIEDLLDALDLESRKGESEAQPGLAEENSIRVAFIGRPNVGKSSLVNRLLGEERMIVSEIPGTTRDSIGIKLDKGKARYTLIDTAGIRKKGRVKEPIEKFSVLQALATLERCDIAILVIDASEGMTEQDSHVVGYSLERGRACLIAVNKWDLLANDPKQQKWITDDIERKINFVGYAPTMNVSALTGKGMDRILPAAKAVYAQYSKTFTTSKLNKVLAEAIEAHTPPMVKGRRLKFFYATQAGTRPPSVIIFANSTKDIHFSYERYLNNAFRKALGLDKSPIRIIFRERQRRP